MIEWKISKEPIHFSDAMDFMENRVDEIIAKKANEMIWLLEHQSVYTAGISAKDDDLIGKSEIPVFKTNRGGKYTYHGPGMKIIYVMLDLKNCFCRKCPIFLASSNCLKNGSLKFWLNLALRERSEKIVLEYGYQRRKAKRRSRLLE